MARFVLAWELGGGLGHVVPLAQLASALLARGHEVHLVWRDLSSSRAVFGPGFDAPGLHLWQAPCWAAEPDTPPQPATHAEVLFKAGYRDAGPLLGLARAWRQLFDAIRPAVLVADHAPTALLAARGQPMQLALFGNGFCVPPARTPMPVFRDWEDAPVDRVRAAEAKVLDTSNRVLQGLGQLPLPALGRLFEAPSTVVLGWDELDHCRSWRTESPSYQGIFPALRQGGESRWPETDGPRLLAYLHATHPARDAALAVLREGPWCSLLHLGGSSRADAERLSGGRLRVTAELIDFSRTWPQAEVFLAQGNTGSTYAALAAGVPCVMLPQQAEQLLLARRVVTAGAGVCLWPEEVAQGLPQALQAVIGSPGFHEAARALAARHAGRTPEAFLAAVADHCEWLAAQPVEAG